ncbi:MAG: hypothetical protein RL037_1917 [Bacteroidota bacterium]|jgi:hypothetical protein
MIRLFSGNRVGVLFLLPLFVIIFQVLHWQTGQVESEVNDFGLWGELFVPEYLSYILSGIFITGNALLLNSIYNRHQFLDKNSYLTSFLYVVLMTFCHAFYHFDYLICVHSLLLLMLQQFFEIKQQTDARQHVFNAFVFIGAASTLQPLLLLFSPFFMISLYNLRSFYWRESILAILGIAVPFLYCLTFLWWYNLDYLDNVDFSTFSYQLTDFIWNFLFIALIIIITFFGLRPKLKKSSVRLKKQVQVLWILVIMGLCVGVFSLLQKSEWDNLTIALLFLISLSTFSFLHKTYGVISVCILYFSIAYSMLKFFIA